VADDEVAQCVEETGMRGFTIIKDLLPAEELTVWREKIDRIYERQEKEFGREALAAIQEIDICRPPLMYDFEFIKLATHQHFLPIILAFLVDWFVLNLQNAIINRPNKGHHQSSWQRDLPYQNCVMSRPLAINVLLNRQAAAASAGSAIVFDSMLFHRAGANTSSVIRRAVNQLYTSPIIKQQYDFPRALGAQPRLEPAIARLLGYDSQVPIEDQAWRRLRRERREKPS
jgi:ectoine hydroxylase-related dioxygenase (phytanoyl-CoA dioxygenase family)